MRLIKFLKEQDKNIFFHCQLSIEKRGGVIIKDLLKKHLIEFKSLTEQIINAINNDISEEIDELFVKRQKIINEIDSFQYSKEAFIDICNELNIINISKKLDELAVKKPIELKEKINNLNEQKKANISYAKNSYARTSFFSTKI